MVDRVRLIAFGLAGVVITGIVACVPEYECEYERIRIPEAAVNLAPMNSPYDDWNCGPSWEEMAVGSGLLFSSNRNSQGRDFDLIPHNLWISSDSPEKFMLSNDAYSWAYEYWRMDAIATAINNDNDQLGPTFITDSALAYAEGLGEQHDLQAIVVPPASHDTDLVIWSTIDSSDQVQVVNPAAIRVVLAPLNSSGDEGYLGYDAVSRHLYFHSNRSGAYRLYEVTLPSGTEPLAWLANPDGNITLREMSELAADGNDRTPFVKDGRMFFVSDRSGGYGGFDIYYSSWSSAGWSTPVNLGANVNSESNEYRPAYLAQFSQGEALIFSSDRAGGQGGYDLYMAKVITDSSL